ncbi:MAG: methyltransferase family protein [Candidatus Njordarchaeia archaeon]
MFTLFFTSLSTFILSTLLNIASVKHAAFEEMFGEKKGEAVCTFLGLLGSYLLFGSMIGMWFSPQPPLDFFAEDAVIKLNLFGFTQFRFTIQQLLFSIPLLVIGAWFGIWGVKEISLTVSSTHRPNSVVKSGLYRYLRHPQYLGGVISHIAISVLLNALYSILATPIVIFCLYIMALEEEKELVKEFSEEYLEYKKNVPMFLIRLGKNKVD